MSSIVGEGIAHIHALRERLGSGLRVSSNLCLTGPSGFEWMSPTVKRLSCGSFAVELTLPILAHKPAAKLRSLRRTLHRLELDTLRLLTSQLLAEWQLLSGPRRSLRQTSSERRLSGVIPLGFPSHHGHTAGTML